MIDRQRLDCFGQAMFKQPHLYLFSILLLFHCSPAWSGTAPSYQEKLNAVISDPANPQTSFEFVKEAIQAGDIRGAIAALERILKLDPGLFNIRLELGSLYLRAGSPALAAGYIRQALSDPSMPPDDRSKAKQLLLQAEKSSQKSFTSGYLKFGLNHDDNANAGPETRDILLNGNIIPNGLNEKDTGRSDSSLELQAYLQYHKLMDGQRGNRWELDVLTYNRLYQEISRINSNLLRFSAGPRLAIGNNDKQPTYLKPFLQASKLWLDGDDYRTSLGGGVNLTHYWPRTRGNVRVLAENQDYSDSSERPTASDRNGTFYSLDSNLDYQISPRMRFSIGVYLSRRDSDEGFEAYDETGARMALQNRFFPSKEATGRAWTSTLRLSASNTEYDDVDPQIDLVSPRSDDRINLRWTVDAPVAPAWNASATAGYTDNTSNKVNFEYDSWNVGLSLTYAF